MDNVKISLTINLKGRLVDSKQSCFKNGKKVVVYKPCKQVINLSQEAYDYMTNKKNVPFWSKPSLWNMCGKKGKLDQHFQKIMEDLGGISFEYTILDE